MENTFVFSKQCRQKLKSFSTSGALTEHWKYEDGGWFANGDPLEWDRFRETYEAAIRQNTRISNVQKFSYLINYFDASAKQAVGGFPVTNQAY